jgi:hypothetical protein
VVLGVLGGLGWVVARVLRSPPTDRAGAHRAVAAVPGAAHGRGRTSTPAAWGAASGPASAAPARRARPRPGERSRRSPPAAARPLPRPLPRPPPRRRRPAAVPLAAAGLPAPPPDVSPGLLAVLDGRGKGTDAVTATLLDLAVRGYFRVEEQAGRRPRGVDARRHRAPPRPTGLAPHEEALLHSAFGGRPTTTITTVCTGRTRTRTRPTGRSSPRPSRAAGWRRT